MPFIRVKSAVNSDPQHEFDVSTGEYEANKGLYAVVDRKPSDEARLPTYVTSVAETKSGGTTKKGRA